MDVSFGFCIAFIFQLCSLFFAPSPGPSNHSPNLSDPWEWGLFTDSPKIISVYKAFIPQDHPIAPQGPFKLSDFGS